MEYKLRKPALLLLEDGTIFYGKSIGDIDGFATGEICFNTGMTGYQEVFTDPSYYGQVLVTTNAHIGNYGTNANEIESSSIKISGLVCRNFSYNYSRVDSDFSLQDFLNKHNLFGISDIDTRALVRHIREKGAMNAIISTDVNNTAGLKTKLSKVPAMEGLELASMVSTKSAYHFGDANATYRIAALDLGIKTNILRNLSERDAYIKVFPYNATYQDMSEWQPDGYFISNGPGDPEPLKEAQQTAKDIISSGKPLFGICLGHQVIALANGISTFKMHSGHRGINHPIKNNLTQKGEITSQNHGFAVNYEEAIANTAIEITHTHLNDQTVAGIKIKDKPCFSVQYHPEANPGPHDASYLFDQFLEAIKTHKTH